MNTRVVVGQYYPANSIIHALDPRIKFLASFIYIIMIFFADTLLSSIFAAFFICVVCALSKLPIKLLLKGLKSIIFILSFTVVLNIFLTPGETIIFEFYFLKITQEGLIIAVRLAMRLVLLIISSSVLTLTTTPVSLTAAIDYYLSPLSKIKIPTQDISMMMSIALRFIPTLMEETDKIIKAQKARGANFETGSLTKRASALIPILVPLFLSAFRRAEDLACAMEARCYRSDIKRSKMKVLRFSKRDYLAFLIVLIYIIGILCIRTLVIFY